MKTKLIFQTLLFSSFAILLSCQGNQKNNYEKAIADYVQTDRRGNWTDLQFKVVSLETTPLTAKDSIRILTEAFDEKQSEAIAREEKNIAYWKESLKENEQAKYAKGFMDEIYANNIKNIEHRLDSIRNLQPEIPSSLQSRQLDEVVAIEARCRYSIVLPGFNTRQESTNIFLLTPDGKSVTGRKPAKEQKTKHADQ